LEGVDGELVATLCEFNNPAWLSSGIGSIFGLGIEDFVGFAARLGDGFVSATDDVV
jgi:hypothetical protein